MVRCEMVERRNERYACMCMSCVWCVCTGIYHTHILFVLSDERDIYGIGAVTLSCYVARKMIYGVHNFRFVASTAQISIDIFDRSVQLDDSPPTLSK